MAEQVRPPRFRILVVLLCFLQPVLVELKDIKDVRKSFEAQHHIISLDASCTEDAMEVHMAFGSAPGASAFKGAIHAKGFPFECRSESPLNSSDAVTTLTLRLPSESCGVRVIRTEDDGLGQLTYQAEIEVQWDRSLQQLMDESRVVRCLVPVRQQRRLTSSRTPRKEEPRRSIQAWMEIYGRRGGKLPNHHNHIVGEQLTMVVKSYLPSGLKARVVNCTAHDGRVNGPEQHLLDGHGCPLDAGIMPAPTAYQRETAKNYSTKGKALPSYEAATSFLAFKFPDREFIHLRCWLQICRGNCAQVDCSLQNDYLEEVQYRRDKNEVTRLEVFNSLNVRAPGIETEAAGYEGPSRKVLVPEDARRLLCMSPSKLALAFAILGLVFLAAIAISMYICLRGRDHRKALYWPPLSRSSSSTSFLSRSRQTPFFLGR